MAGRRDFMTVLLAAGVAPALALAQPQQPSASTPAPPAPHTGALRTEMVSSLIVLNARGATLEGERLTLSGVSPNVIVFADRPVRAAGHVLTRHLLEEWSDGKDSFGRDPPNATVSVLSANADSVRDAVVVLRAPRLEGERLDFEVRVLEGSLAGADGPASVFIDIIGMPWTPLSFAGVARRTARRAYWYDAARYYPPPPYYYRPPPPYPYYGYPPY